MHLRTATLALGSMLVVCGCAEQKEQDPLPVTPATPLEHDPTDAFELGEWWSNGKEMLQLERDRRFALYGDLNRYHLPIERGRWGQTSYAVVNLEPYDRLAATRERVEISRGSDGELTLTVPELAPMTAMAAPPHVPEDDLLGEWESSAGRLRFGADRRYEFSSAPIGGAHGAMVAGHRGTWLLEKERVVLTPYPAGIESFELQVERDGRGGFLAGPDVEFRRAEQDRSMRPGPEGRS